MRHNDQPETVFKVAAPIIGAILLSLIVGLFASQQEDMAIYVVTGFFVFFVLFIRGDFILYGLIFSMLLSPEIVVGATLKREVTVRFEDFLILIMAISWLAKTAITKNPGLVFQSPFNGRVIIYLSICALSTTFGMLAGRVDYRAGSLFVIKYIEFFLVYVVVLNSIRDRASIRNYVTAMLIVCGIICIMGFIQYFQGEAVTTPFEGRQSERNTLGGYLVLIFSLSLGLFVAIKSWKFRIPLLLLLVLILGTLTVSLSRGAWLAVVSSVIFLVFTTRSDRRFLIAIILLALVAVILFAPDVTRDRLSYTIHQGVAQEQRIEIFSYRLDTSTSARILSFQQALEQFYKHPLLGWGITGFVFIDSQYFRLLAEIGLLGLLSFLFVIFGIWKTATSLLDGLKDFEYGLVLGFLAGFVGLMVHSLGANTFIIVRIMEPFWFLASLITFMYIEDHNPEIKERFES